MVLFVTFWIPPPIYMPLLCRRICHPNERDILQIVGYYCKVTEESLLSCCEFVEKATHRPDVDFVGKFVMEPKLWGTIAG